MTLAPHSNSRTTRHSLRSEASIPSLPRILFLLPLLLLFAFASSPFQARAQTGSPSPRKLSLRECIDTALEKNLDLKIIRSGERIASYQLDVEKAAFDPAFVAISGYRDRLSPGGGSELEGADQNRTNRGDVTTGIEKNLKTGGAIELTTDLLDRSETNSQFARLNPEYLSSLNLRLRQPLLKTAGFTYNLAPIRLAELEVNRANLESFNSLLLTLRDTEQAYWLVVSTNRAVEIAESSVELGELILEETSEREQASLATKVDVLESRASVAESEEALLLATKLHEDAKDLLFNIMGILAEDEPGTLDLEPLPYNSQFRPDPATSFETALQNAPTIQLQYNALQQREIDRQRARNEKRPALDLNANSGLLGRDFTQGRAYDRTLEGDGYFWEVLLEFRVPFGRRAEKARYAESLAALERQRLSASDVKLDLYTDIRTACREVNLSHERLRVTKVSEELNTERFEQKQSERRSGQITQRDLLEAQEDMQRARLRYLEAQAGLLRAITDLAQLEGTLPHRYGLVLDDDYDVAGSTGAAK